jgi:hypothetical protein
VTTITEIRQGDEYVAWGQLTATTRMDIAIAELLPFLIEKKG